MSTQRPIDPQRLLAQTAWVRRLALSLARDEASADDLVQETFAAALRRPPQDIEAEAGLRAWFATVVRNFAFRQGRETQRRTRREQLRSVPESSHAEERARELEEMRTELFEHVVALPEDLREVVLLHYFEELDSAEIARRLGAPDSTIRNRLRRALAELRVRLERKHGSDWRNLCLFALPSTGAKVAAGTGALAAAGGLWIGGGAVAVLALALLLTWQHWRPERIEATDTAALAALPVVESAHAAPPAPDQATAPSERTPEPVAANTKPFLLYGRVLDAQQKPVKSASVELTDDRNQRTSSQNSPEGWYSFTALVPGLYDARIEADGGAPLVAQLDVRAAAGDTRRDFTLGAVSYVQVRLLRSDGTLWVVRPFAESFEREFEVCVVATADKPGKTLGPQTWGDYSNFGVGRYRSPQRNGSTGVPHQLPGSSGVLEVFGPRPCFASLVQGARVLETKIVDAGTEKLEFVVDENFVAGLAASATGIVIDERTGAPVPDICVSLSPYWRGGSGSTSDAQGRVEFKELATGTLQLAFGGRFSGLGGLSRSIEIQPGMAHDLGTLPWLPERALHAHILDSAGNPAAATIRLTLDDPGLDPAWCAPNMQGESDSAGRFEWANSPGFATTIVASRKGPNPEAGVVTIVRGYEGAAELRLLPARTVGLHSNLEHGARTRIRISDAHGTTWADAGSGWSLILPDGEYRAVAWIEGRKSGECAFHVDASTRGIDLKF